MVQILINIVQLFDILYITTTLNIREHHRAHCCERWSTLIGKNKFIGPKEAVFKLSHSSLVMSFFHSSGLRNLDLYAPYIFPNYFNTEH